MIAKKIKNFKLQKKTVKLLRKLLETAYIPFNKLYTKYMFEKISAGS